MLKSTNDYLLMAGECQNSSMARVEDVVCSTGSIVLPPVTVSENHIDMPGTESEVLNANKVSPSIRQTAIGADVVASGIC